MDEEGAIDVPEALLLRLLTRKDLENVTLEVPVPVSIVEQLELKAASGDPVFGQLKMLVLDQNNVPSPETVARLVCLAPRFEVVVYEKFPMFGNNDQGRMLAFVNKFIPGLKCVDVVP